MIDPKPTEVDVSSPLDPIFTGATIKSKSLPKQGTLAGQGMPGPPPYQGHDISAIKTYRYLRIGMLVAVIALASSILEEYWKPGVSCFMGSISGYYYTPIHSVFISVMVAIGVALIVIKGKTATEDALLREPELPDRRDMWSGLRSDSAPSCCEYSESSAQ